MPEYPKGCLANPNSILQAIQLKLNTDNLPNCRPETNG